MRLLYATTIENTFLSKDISILVNLKIVKISNERKTLTINSTFQRTLHDALVGSGAHHSFGMPYDDGSSHLRSIIELDKFALNSWQSVLYSLVGSKQTQKPKVKNFLTLDY